MPRADQASRIEAPVTVGERAAPLSGERPSRRAVLGTLGGGLSLSRPSRVWAAAADAASLPSLRRGLNIHHLLSWPATAGAADAPTYVWPPFADRLHAPDPRELRRIRAVGFDFIRLTLGPGLLLAADEAQREEIARIVLDRIARAQAADLSVVLDLHPVTQDPRWTPARLVDPATPEVFDAYVRLVGWLAGALASVPPGRLAFEPLNEPALPHTSDAPRWAAMLARLHDVARRDAPHLPLVLSGANWSAAGALARLDASRFRGSAVIYTFHYYAPRAFTHQGMPGADTRYIRGLRWPPDPKASAAAERRATALIAADRSLDERGRSQALADTRIILAGYDRDAPDGPALEADLALVAAWAARSGIDSSRILLGEFGAARHPDMSPTEGADRERWLRSVRACAEGHGFAWAYWSYRSYGGMALADETDSHDMYRPDLVALGLLPG